MHHHLRKAGRTNIVHTHTHTHTWKQIRIFTEQVKGNGGISVTATTDSFQLRSQYTRRLQGPWFMGVKTAQQCRINCFRKSKLRQDILADSVRAPDGRVGWGGGGGSHGSRSMRHTGTLPAVIVPRRLLEAAGRIKRGNSVTECRWIF